MRREFSTAVRAAAVTRAKARCEICGSKRALEYHHRGHGADNSAFNLPSAVRRLS
jgi:ATP-dependent exoDNAse (exonuclease V) alpha subunit